MVYDWGMLIAAYMAGSEKNHCESGRDMQCTLNGLLPGIPYRVCVRTCFVGVTTQMDAESSIKRVRLALSNETIEGGLIGGMDKVPCSEPDCGNITIPMEGKNC